MRSEAIALALACAALLGGCARTVLDSSVVDTRFDDEQNFWTDLETRRVVTNNDALHGLFLAADGVDPNPSYEDRLFAARERAWIGDDFQPDTRPANQSANIGDLSVAACRIANIKGGLTMRILGPTPRYATKELVYRQMIPDRGDNQSMTGLEFIDFVTRIQDLTPMAGAPVPAPTTPAPPENPPPQPDERPEPLPEAPPRPGTL